MTLMTEDVLLRINKMFDPLYKEFAKIELIQETDEEGKPIPRPELDGPELSLEHLRILNCASELTHEIANYLPKETHRLLCIEHMEAIVELVNLAFESAENGND